MSDMIAAAILQLVLVATLVLAVVMFVRLRRQVRTGVRSRGKAALMYFGLTLCPLAVLVAFFFALIGLEELTESALVPETFARASPLAAFLCLVVATIATITFTLAARPPSRNAK